MNQSTSTPSLVVGLTGGIGSGKSAVSDWFIAQNIDVIDADVIAHRLTAPNAPLLDTLKATFGNWVILADGSYNRQQMRTLVFNDANALATLNAIIHPAIYQAITSALKNTKSNYVILSAPLLLEGRHKSPNLLHLCQKLLVIDTPVSAQLSRVAARSGMNEAQAQAIINHQISREQRLQLAQTLKADIIINDGDLAALYSKLKPLHTHYLMLSGGVHAV